MWSCSCLLWPCSTAAPYPTSSQGSYIWTIRHSHFPPKCGGGVHLIVQKIWWLENIGLGWNFTKKNIMQLYLVLEVMTLQGLLPAKYSVRLLKINVDSFAQTWHELMRLLNKYTHTRTPKTRASCTDLVLLQIGQVCSCLGCHLWTSGLVLPGHSG